jgi:hypothetical protein
MAEYREAGTGGFANSTVRAKASAMIHFSTYLRTKNLDYLTMTEDDLCKETLFRQFGTYLISEEKCRDPGGKEKSKQGAKVTQTVSPLNFLFIY